MIFQEEGSWRMKLRSPEERRHGKTIRVTLITMTIRGSPTMGFAFLPLLPKEEALIDSEIIPVLSLGFDRSFSDFL